MLGLVLISITRGPTHSPPASWRSGWQPTHPLLTARSGAGAAAVRGVLYVVGGAVAEASGPRFLDTVEAAKVRPDGSLESWHEVKRLLTPRGFIACVEAKGFLYAVGGMTFLDAPRGRLLNTVERARILEDGSLGPWAAVAPLTTPRRGPAVVVAADFLYAIGGYNGLFLNTVERARIREDGSLASWEVVPDILTTTRYIHGATVEAGRVYVFGGKNREDGSAKNSVEFSQIQPDGALGPWHEGPGLLVPRFLSASAALHGYLFVLGGYNGRYLDGVERARAGPEGLEPWSEVARLSQPKEGMAVVASGLYLYVIGGSRSGTYFRDVEYAAVGPDGDLGHSTTPPATSPAPGS